MCIIRQVCSMHRRDMSDKSEFTSTYQNWRCDCYKHLRVNADPVRNSYLNWDFGRSRLPSSFKWMFSGTRAVLVLLRLLRFLLVTVSCTLTDTLISTRSKPHNCGSTTYITSWYTIKYSTQILFNKSQWNIKILGNNKIEIKRMEESDIVAIPVYLIFC